MNLLISLTPQGRAAKIATAIIGRLGRVGKIIINRAGQGKPPLPPKKPDGNKPQKPKPDITKRPEGVPKDWVAKPTEKGDGVVYEKPGSKGGTYVKVQKGNPNSSNSGQRYDNVRVTKDGKSLDKNGNVVPKKSQESHIPVKDFKFDPELFQ